MTRTGLQCTLNAASIPGGLGTYFCTAEPDRIERYCGGVAPPSVPPTGAPEPSDNNNSCKAKDGEAVGRPILPATAEKYRSELDWADAAGPSALSFQRIYRSNRGTDTARPVAPLGKVWTHSHSTTA